MKTPGNPFSDVPTVPVEIMIPGADFDDIIGTERVMGYNWANFWDKWREQSSA
jgi:hypothetical protein